MLKYRFNQYLILLVYLFISSTIIFRITKQTYGVNDDVIIQDWLSGFYTGNSEIMLRASATPRITFGFIVSNLYKFFPTINWFSIILLALVILSWYLLGILTLKSKHILSTIVYFLVSFLHLLWFISSPTYTAATVILSFSTLIYLSRQIIENNIKLNFILISIIYGFSFLIRPESFILGTMVSLPVIVFSAIKENKVVKSNIKFILISAFFVLSIIGADYVFEGVYISKNSNWSEYQIWENARYKIQANTPEKVVLENPINFGWTEAEAEIFKNYDYIDSNNFTITKLNKLILESKSKTDFNFSFIQNAHQQIFDSDINWEWKPLIELISLVYIIFFLSSLPKSLTYIFLSSSSLIIIYFIMMYVAGFLRQPERVQVSVIFLSILSSWASFLFVQKSSNNVDFKVFSISACFVLILSFNAFYSQASHLKNRTGDAPNSFWVAEKELLSTFPKDSIFVGNSSKFRNNWQSPYRINRSEVEQRIFTFGWHNFSPHWKIRAQSLGLDPNNMFKSVIQDSRVFWVTDTLSMRYIVTYMKEQNYKFTGPDIVGGIVYEGNEYKVWNFSPSE